MSNLYWLTDEQMARLKPFFPKSHGVLRVDGISFVMWHILFSARTAARQQRLDMPPNPRFIEGFPLPVEAHG
jgi:transposase